MNKERLIFSFIVCIVVFIYPIIQIGNSLSLKVDTDEFLELGFAVENNTLYNLKLVEKGIDRKVDIFHIFQKINEEPKLDTMQKALDEDYTILLTLEPWQGNGKNNDIYNPNAIINGSIDQDIDRWAIELNSLKFDKGKLIIRTMHEINGNWYPWCAYSKNSSPENSKLAYMHFVNRYKIINDKTLFMFGINYRGKKFSGNGTQDIYDVDETLVDEKYYDIIGISGYNRVSKYHTWKSFDEIYNPIYANLTDRTNKSIWIAEISSVSNGGDKAEWIKDMFDQVKFNFTRIDAVVWFDENKWYMGNVTDWAFDSTPESGIAFKESVRIENMRK